MTPVLILMAAATGFILWNGIRTAQAGANLQIIPLQIYGFEFTPNGIQAKIRIRFVNTTQRTLDLQQVSLFIGLNGKNLGHMLYPTVGQAFNPATGRLPELQGKDITFPVLIPTLQAISFFGSTALEAIKTKDWKAIMPKQFFITGRVTANGFGTDISNIIQTGL